MIPTDGVVSNHTVHEARTLEKKREGRQEGGKGEGEHTVR